MRKTEARPQQHRINLLLFSVLSLSSLFISFPALAATPSGTPCGNVMNATTDPQACDVGITLEIAPGELTDQTDQNVTFTSSNVNPADATHSHPYMIAGTQAQTATFKFSNHLIDSRNIQAGWTLAASSNGLTNSNGGPDITTIMLSADAADSVCNSANGCNPPLQNIQYLTNVTLNASPQAFVRAFNQATPSHGDYTLPAVGSFVVPAAASAGGTYSGVITVTVTNAPVD